MGGRALKNCFTRRYQRDEFDVISTELIETLNETFYKVAMPLFYRKKESFGDADILVMAMPNFNMREYLTETFHPNEIFHNGNCWSFDYKELQVDIITTPEEHFASNLMYLSYNDLGNYIGRLAHGFGMKYGQEGLWLEYQFKGSNVGSIEISKDYPKIFEFLGLSFERFQQGFDTLEEIFIYIATSKYFNWKMFQLSELNKINRDRNAKRTSYMAFLDWIDKNAADSNHYYLFLQDKTVYHKDIDMVFPEANLFSEIRRLEYETCRDLYIKGKFNGGMVMRKYGFQGKELGEKLLGFKDLMNDLDGYEKFVLENDTATILERFDEYLAEKA